MNGLRFWYLKHFKEEALYDELSGPAEGNYVVVQDGPNTSVRVRAEELESYAKYFTEKATRYTEAYERLKKLKQ